MPSFGFHDVSSFPDKSSRIISNWLDYQIPLVFIFNNWCMRVYIYIYTLTLLQNKVCDNSWIPYFSLMQQNEEDMGIYLIFAATIGLAYIVIMVAAVLGQGCDHHCHRHHLLVLGHRSFHNEGVSCRSDRVIRVLVKLVTWSGRN